MIEDPEFYKRFGTFDPENEAREEREARIGKVVPKTTEFSSRVLAELYKTPALFPDEKVFRAFAEVAITIQEKEGRELFYDEVIEEAKKAGIFIAETGIGQDTPDVSFYGHWISFMERKAMKERDEIISNSHGFPDSIVQFQIDAIRQAIAEDRRNIAKMAFPDIFH